MDNPHVVRRYRKARQHERASLAMSGAEATLVKPDEMG